MVNTARATRAGRSPAAATLIAFVALAALFPLSTPAGAVEIIALHNNTSQGIPASPYTIGTQVTVTGVITVGHGTYTPSYLDVYLQDATAGISIYDATVAYPFALGDSVTITGAIAQYRGTTEIDYQSHVLHAHGAELPAPFVVTCHDVEYAFGPAPTYSEPNEGRLVRLEQVSWTGSWPTGSGGVTLHDASGTCTMYIDQDTGIQSMTPPSGPFNVTGIIKQYAGYSPPYTSSYEILPRSPADIDILPGPQILDGPRETNIQYDNVTIHLETDLPTTAVVHYGLTSAHELGTATDGITATVHDVVVAGLSAAKIYHYDVTVANETGQTTTPDRLFCSGSGPGCTGEMICLFNESVDHDYAGTTPAQGNQDFTTWIIQRINAAVGTIDVAMYSFDLANVADALIAAKNRGVTVRFVYEYRNPYQTQVQRLISAGIPVIDDTFGPNNGEGLMHNKFWVFDVGHADPSKPWVVTGSWNVTDQGTYTDQQNFLMVQDQAMARIFTTEFNEMWGSAIWIPNSDHSRFGANKTDDTPKLLNVAGREVKVYFGPSDPWMNALIMEVREAHSSIDFCVLSFTRYDLSNEMQALFYTIPSFAVRGVFDSGQTGDPNSQWWPMSGQGDYPWNPPADVWLDAELGFLHHKYMLIDSQNSGSDPVIITGSANWSSSAMSSNDENIVFIHDSDLVNQYLQEFAARYHAAGGSSLQPLSAVEPSPVAATAALKIGPSPARSALELRFALASAGPVRVELYGPDGRLVERVLDQALDAGHHVIRWQAGSGAGSSSGSVSGSGSRSGSGLASGMYFVRVTTPAGVAERRVAFVR